MANMEIKVGAEVSGAIAGLNQVQNELNETAKAAIGFDDDLQKAASKLRQLPSVTNQATFTLNNFTRVVQDAPYGIRGVANNIDPLVESFLLLRNQTGSTTGAFKGMLQALSGPSGILLAVSTATTLMVAFSDELAKVFGVAKKTETGVMDLKDGINDIFTETAKEATAVNSFIAILKNETETRQRKLEAIQELKNIQPDIFANLSLEGNLVQGLDSAYSSYLDNLKTVIAVKIKQLQLEQLIEQQLKQQGITLVGNDKKLFEGTKKLQDALSNDPRLQGGDVAKIKKYYDDQEVASRKATESLQQDINDLFADIIDLSKGIKTTPLKEVKIKPQKIVVDNKYSPIEFEKPLTTTELLPLQFGPDTTDAVRNLEKILEQISFYRVQQGFETLQGYVKGTRAESILAKTALKDLGQVDFIGFSGIATDQKALDTLLLTIKNRIEEIRSTAAVLGSILTPAFAGLFEEIDRGGDALGGFFEGLTKGIKQLFQVLLQTAAIAGLVSLITGVPFAASFKTLAGFSLPGRANGGPVSGGNPYLIGERGPELFVPSVSGSVIPNNSIGSFMGGMMGGRNSGMTTLRGQDIILAYARTQRSQLRVNG
jgi:hypothetical protein